jgi:hypothetical protein
MLHGVSLFSLPVLRKLPFFSKQKEEEQKNKQNKIQSKFKVFEPPKEALFKEKIKQSIPLKIGKKTKKTLSFGFKTKQHFSSLKSFSPSGFSLYIKLTLMRWKVFEKFNQFIMQAVFALTACFIVYLSLFDTTFLVKSYSFSYVQNPQSNSYLDSQNTQKFIESIKNHKFLGVVPSNQLWFLNSHNLTYVAKKSNPEIAHVSVDRRVWPNTTELSITTEPILLTLGINNGEYWRISKEGEIVTQDDAGIREKLVVVDLKVDFNKSDKRLSDISFENNSTQLNRFWYTIWLWEQLKPFELEIVKTSYPSLFDTDVNIHLSNGTVLNFSSETTSLDGQKKRIESVFSHQKYIAEIKSGVYKYVDFRVFKKLFLCKIGELCAK